MKKLKWWQTAVFYQIYPRSFADGNGDGIGDFPGMTAKLDYLKSLGVDALWLSPHFPSPNWDCGYDISDYENVAPEYGTLPDFRVFLNEAHDRGLRVILDLVLNHTSDQHPWFIESKSSRDNPKSDWYVWENPAPVPKSPRDTSPTSNIKKSEELGENEPNNWQSCFDGPAWTYSRERGQYYYHFFMKQQPDLNWHNSEVKAAMWKSVRFWLDIGVDGFRLDAIGTIFEHPDRPNHPVPMTLAELRHFDDDARTDDEKKVLSKYWHDMFMYQWGHPHGLMKELRTVLKEYPGDRILVGEDDDVSYLGTGDDELNMVFNFPLMRTDRITSDWVRQNQKKRLGDLSKVSPNAWPCNTLGNHDCSRIYTRYGDGIHDAELAQLNLALILTLRGTPFLYNGEEIGMTDLLILEPAKLRDTMATWYYDALVRDLKEEPADAALRTARITRDKNRTPMQWTSETNGGFCPSSVAPWLPVNPNYAEGISVDAQENDPDSLLNFYRRMLRIRKETPALIDGDFQVLLPVAHDYLAFLRGNKKQSVLVVLNYSSNLHSLNFVGIDGISLRTIFSSTNRAKIENSCNIHVSPFEVLISELT